MPASTTPMMLVHVYSDTPTCGARIRPATSSITSVQKLAMKTHRLALMTSRCMRSLSVSQDVGSSGRILALRGRGEGLPASAFAHRLWLHENLPDARRGSFGRAGAGQKRLAQTGGRRRPARP